MKRLGLGLVVILFSGFAMTQDWIDSSVGYEPYVAKSVKIKSESGDESLSIFRKPSNLIANKYPKEMVFIEFSTSSLDQIASRGAVIYKASQGKAFPLGSIGLGGGFTSSIESTAFHGKSSPTCGIVGNIIHSEKLTVRYQTLNGQTKDVVFELPTNHDALFDLLGFDKLKDCVQVSE